MGCGESIPCEQLVSWLCDIKQAYTQYGGKRPFGVSILYMGWDKHFGYQLYQSDPSGNYGGWKATCIGNNESTAKSILKTDWKEELDLEEGISLALKILNKTLDVQKLTEDRFELAQLKLDDAGELKFSFLSQKDKKKRCEVLAAEIEKQKKEAAAKLKEQQRKDAEASSSK